MQTYCRVESNTKNIRSWEEVGSVPFFVFMCVRIQERHAVFRNEQRRVTLTPMTGTKVIVNGNPVSQTTELQHLVGLDSNLNYMMWFCDMLLKYTLYIYF